MQLCASSSTWHKAPPTPPTVDTIVSGLHSRAGSRSRSSATVDGQNSVSAADAWCFCGGGTARGDDVRIQSVESGECVDVPGFFDTYFDGCGWYAAAALVYWST